MITNWTKFKKPSATKVWNSKDKYWDYELSDKNWKPKYKHITKKIIEKLEYGDWFDDKDLSTIDEIRELKEKAREDYENYNLNKFKIYLNYKKYLYYTSLEMLFMDFKRIYTNKEILYCKEKLINIYNKKPSLERLKYRKKTHIFDNLKDISGINLGIVSYWIFKDTIIFK